MVTMTEESDKQSLPMETSPCNNEKSTLDSEVHSTSLSDSKSAQHNFHSMAELIRHQENDISFGRDMTLMRDISKNDENENSVQDLRLSGVGNGGSSTSRMREEHLRRWYSGDLGRAPVGALPSMADVTDMVDVDGHSSHSGIPSDLSSEGEDQAEINAVQADLISKHNKLSDEEEMKQNGDAVGVVKSPPSICEDVDNLSDTETDMRKSKRKQYTPKQRDCIRGSSPSEEPQSKMRKLEHNSLQNQLKLIQRQLLEMQSKVLTIGQTEVLASMENRAKSELSHSPETSRNNHNSVLSPLGVKVNMSRSLETNGGSSLKNTSPVQGDTPKDLDDLAKTLKNELTSQVGTMVDVIMAKYAESRKKLNESSPPKEKINTTPPSPVSEKTPVNNGTTRVNPALMHHNERMAMNLSPRVLPRSDHLPRTHHVSGLPDSMKNFPFPFNKPKHEPHENKPMQPQQHENKLEIPKPQKPMKLNDKLGMAPYFDPTRAFGEFPRPMPWFPHLPCYPPAQVPSIPALHAAFGGAMHLKDQDQTEALPLVVSSPKKKRTKVTDTRLSPRAARALLQEPVPAEQPLMTHAPSSMSPLNDRKEIPMPPSSSFHHTPLIPASLPTSVAIPNPSLQHSDIFGGLYGPKMAESIFSRAAAAAEMHHNFNTPTTRSPPVRDDSNSPIYTPSDSPSMFRDNSCYGGEETNADGFPLTSTLTPMHLRKAKLMFFFVRYPSSSILKVFFPDVKFNKNNTAQLVKWFSNFREFYYIQMEKYARQAIAEGVKNPEEIMITTDSELYRVLNLHYNRNNQLEVPEGFRVTVQATLREFFKAVGMNKDTEQSWKKPIYKIIARMDDAVPEYFKNANWMEQLNDL